MIRRTRESWHDESKARERDARTVPPLTEYECNKRERNDDTTNGKQTGAKQEMTQYCPHNQTCGPVDTLPHVPINGTREKMQ